MLKDIGQIAHKLQSFFVKNKKKCTFDSILKKYIKNNECTDK